MLKAQLDMRRNKENTNTTGPREEEKKGACEMQENRASWQSQMKEDQVASSESEEEVDQQEVLYSLCFSHLQKEMLEVSQHLPEKQRNIFQLYNVERFLRVGKGSK